MRERGSKKEMLITSGIGTGGINFNITTGLTIDNIKKECEWIERELGPTQKGSDFTIPSVTVNWEKSKN